MLLVRDPAIKSIKDFKDNHRIAMPAVKVSMQAIMLQMAAAKEFGDAKFNALDHLTVSMAHPDATAAMLGGQSEIVGELLVLAVPVPPDEEPEHPPPADQHRPVRRAAVVQRDRHHLEIPHARIRSSTRRSWRR